MRTAIKVAVGLAVLLLVRALILVRDGKRVIARGEGTVELVVEVLSPGFSRVWQRCCVLSIRRRKTKQTLCKKLFGSFAHWAKYLCVA